ncbi:MAG: 50S ribosomal protein L11 methyltransferase [Thermodesulfobacteriota bacterium]|nr:50S ribosomal protein L11 methyltransferase [Thermodesulfobacteriota bacterium]
MKYIETRVIINTGDPVLAEELIIAIFDDFKLQGVVIEDPNTGPVTASRHTGPESAHHAVIGYFPANSSGKKQCVELESSLNDLKTFQNIDTTVYYHEIDEEDWAESWKAFFWPEKIGNSVVVKPTWREYEPGPGEIIVEIDPGMAFGTGTHPTTALCIRMLEKQLLPGQHILDVGTGSGILLITAAKLGAGSGIGIDNDRVATAIASSNLAQNHLDSDRFSAATGNLIDTITGRFDLVTANILTEVILELIPPLHRVLKPGGLFICSGIIEAYEEKVKKNLQTSGFQIVEKRMQDDWVCIAARTGGRI